MSEVAICPCCGDVAELTLVPLPKIGGYQTLPLWVIGCKCHDERRFTIIGSEDTHRRGFGDLDIAQARTGAHLPVRL